MSKPKLSEVRNALPISRIPHAQSIVVHHLIAAYVYESRSARDRIEKYGRMSKKILRNIGRPAQVDGTVAA